jgi:hypothetical protein
VRVKLASTNIDTKTGAGDLMSCNIEMVRTDRWMTPLALQEASYDWGWSYELMIHRYRNVRRLRHSGSECCAIVSDIEVHKLAYSTHTRFQHTRNQGMGFYRSELVSSIRNVSIAHESMSMKIILHLTSWPILVSSYTRTA